MVFWPRFSFSRNDSGNLVKVSDIFTLRPAPSNHFEADLGVIVTWTGEAIFALYIYIYQIIHIWPYICTFII